MQAWKKALALGLILALPMPAAAATGVRIEPVKAGDDRVSVRITEAAKGDWYHLYVDDYFIGGRLVRAEADAGLRIFKLPANVKVKDGSRIRVEMAKDQAGYLADEQIVGQGRPAPAPAPAPQPSTEQRTSGDRLKAVYPVSARPGERVTPRIYLLDANGTEMNVAASALYSYSGPIEAGSLANGGFVVDKNAREGDVIHLTIVLGEDKTEARVDVSGGAPAPARPSADAPLSAESGPIGSRQDLTLKSATPAGTKSAEVIVRYKDNGAARITASLLDPASLIAKGEGTLALSADRAGGASFSLLYRNAAGQILKDVPFGFYFGTPNLPADQVRMTIGLRTLRVGPHFRTTDQAPFIRDGRTYVPLRALAEAFGAEVAYDSGRQSITVKEGGRQLVMTVGERRYQVNGQEQTVDVAPYLTSTGRTMVPVRFAAEGLGYQLDVHYDGAGLTDHIIFSRG